MKWISGLVLFSSFFLNTQSQAALGEKAEAIASDAKSLKSVRKNADVFKNYSTQEIVSDANTVKEFVANDGTVFAIVWNGISPPDHSVLLGEYSKTYEKNRKASRREKGPRNRKIASETLVVEQSGHMRALEGRMYDPSLIPSGVSIDEIK